MLAWVAAFAAMTESGVTIGRYLFAEPTALTEHEKDDDTTRGA